MTRPIPGGYLDRQLLNRAMRANTAARGIIGRILQEQPGPERLALMLAQLAHHLADQAEALNEMDRIRREAPMARGMELSIEQLRRENERLEREIAEAKRLLEALERSRRRRGGE
ncbi:MAG TPA: hypothetical protein G4O02_16940 [Caldilineae bacterium]|nr:hypothetical protein [Caldilineae bacterium]